LYGDSIESLTALNETIDFFINDSDHSAAYESREYRAVIGKLAPDAVIIADNAHVTLELLHFSRDNERKFLFFREEPADHWYQGAGIGMSFK
jgi:predicted O-methyltransferase YrrM